MLACFAVPPETPMAEHAIVLDADATFGAAGLGGEPITTARLRAFDGTTRVVRIVGGPNRWGGLTRLAGRVVPTKGAVVRVDLRAEPELAWARGTPQATWPASALPVAFTLGGASRDLAGEALAELDVALRTWPLVACTAWRARLAGADPLLVPGDDGKNGVFWHDDAWPPELVAGALGQTVLHTDASGNLRDADIHVNGADYRWSVDGAGSTIDARGVLVHELGHALGLGHSDVPRATMHATHPPGLAWRSLEADDKDGVCALYPGPGVGETACGACPAGFVCVARACERKGARGEVCSPCERVVGACDGAGDDARCIDLPDGRGRVCGRACARDEECGARFRCAPTTSSGDLQCVPTDGCAGGPDVCARDADCTSGVCRGGACVGPADPVAADAGAEAGDAAVPARGATASGGCAIVGRVRGGGAFCVVGALVIALRRARRR